MSEKRDGAQPTGGRVPNGHGYCWAQHGSGVRCCQPKGHSGPHVYPYTPRKTW